MYPPFYILSQQAKEGSVIGKKERRIVIRFNNDNQLTSAYGADIENFTDIGY